MEGDPLKDQATRVAKLWSQLDVDNRGALDKNALKKGLKKIDHPLKNADNLLNEVLKAVDVNRDGKIQYNEFSAFVQHAETELWRLFKTIDKDSNNKISKEELRLAFQSAGIAVSSTKLDAFFDSVDRDHDGQLSFDEWRDFLLFIPAHVPGLKAVMSFYNAGLQVNQEGDVSLKDETINSTGYFVAGGLAGMVSRTTTAPLDRLKVYLIAQIGTQDQAMKAVKSGAPVEATRHAARPLIDASRELWRAGGMRSLFAGNGLNVAKVMPESAIKFGSYEASKRFFAALEGHKDPTQLHPWSQFAAGGMGGIISQFCVYPLDTLKFRMQCETVEGGLYGNRLIVETAKTMWATGGIRSFYRGLTMGLVGMFPYSAIDLTLFEYAKRALIKRKAKRLGLHEDDVALGGFSTAIIGGCSGAVGASIVYPINLLRTRLQTQGTASHHRTYTGIVDVARQTVQGEGVRGLFKGITPNLLKVVPAVSITYVVYENAKRTMKLH